MFFCGYAACMGRHSSDITPTNLDNVVQVKIKNMIVDGFYITRDTDPSRYGLVIPPISKWDFNTILNAPLNGNLLGGNVDFISDEIQSIRVKRAELDSYNWLTLFDVPINNNADLSFTRTDYTARGNQDFKYAFVPVWNDHIEGNYNINTVKSEFNGIWIVDKNTSVNAILNLELSTTRNIVTSTIIPLGRKYPYVNHYGLSNYTSGSFDVTFINYNYLEHDWEIDSASKYRELIEAFLTDGCPKIIKHDDGRIWLACISDSISKNESQHVKMPIQSISFTEIGKYDSPRDLYDSNIIDVNIEGGETNNAILSHTV